MYEPSDHRFNKILGQFGEFKYVQKFLFLFSSKTGSGKHAVRVIGWGTSITGGDYWICVNSWGSHWGESGKVRMKRGENTADSEGFFFGLFYGCTAGQCANDKGKCAPGSCARPDTGPSLLFRFSESRGGQKPQNRKNPQNFNENDPSEPAFGRLGGVKFRSRGGPGGSGGSPKTALIRFDGRLVYVYL